MKWFPMFLRMDGQRVVVVGGGEEAARKFRLVSRTSANITIAAPRLNSELAAQVKSGLAGWHRGMPVAESFAATALVFVGTGCPGADAAISVIARDAGAPVNVVDQPTLCSAITPAIVDRDPLVVAIGTEGSAPVLARQIKSQIETTLEPGLGRYATAAGSLRQLAARYLGARARRDLWGWVFSGDVRRQFMAGDAPGAVGRIRAAITSGQLPQADAPLISIVGVRGNEPDLMTLRGLRHLQEADAVFHDAAISTGVLELARRDATRHLASGAIAKDLAWISEAVKRCDKVVWLMPADAAQDAVRGLKRLGIVAELIPTVSL